MNNNKMAKQHTKGSGSKPSTFTNIRHLLSYLPKNVNLLSMPRLVLDSFRFGKKYGKELKANVGDRAALFELPNAIGLSVKLEELLLKNKVILIFYRGGWCPFCNMQLRAYQNALSDFKKAGAVIVAISPQMPDKSLSMEEKLGLQFTVLSDLGNTVARKYTGVLKYEGKSAEALASFGVDLLEFNDDDSGEVPIPAVFIINQARKIVFAQSEGGDYKKRVETHDVLLALQNLK
jgi:peroxiredoxin